MIHLRARSLSLLVHSPSRGLASRILSITTTTTTSISPDHFTAEDYLVTTCGITRDQALKASKKLSHLQSSSKPDAVLAFLSALGLPSSGIATLVVRDPLFLCASVEKTLAPRVRELSDLGLSRSEISRLIPLTLSSFRSSSLSRNLKFWLSVFGSFEKLIVALRTNFTLLAADHERVAKPNMAVLQQWGLSASHFSEPFLSRVLVRNPKHVQDALIHIDKFGVRRQSRMFLYALVAFTSQTPERLSEKIEYLQMLGWSQDDVSMAVRKLPLILCHSVEGLRKNVEFLTQDAGLEIPYIAQRPALLMYSLERRLVPRYTLLKLLNSKGLLNIKFDYCVASLAEKRFVDKFVYPYKESVPGLADDYASSCALKVPMGLLCPRKEN